MQHAEIEKGPLWGTKPTFFRRKEIRVSLLLNVMQLLCHFSLLFFFLIKMSIDADLIPFSFFLRFLAWIQFFVLLGCFTICGWA